YFTSHRASSRTLSPPDMSRKVPAPRPPQPIRAPPNVSLGGVWPGPPSTCRGTMVNTADAAAAPRRKLRRVTFRFRRVIGSAPLREKPLPHGLNPRLSPARAGVKSAGGRPSRLGCAVVEEVKGLLARAQRLFPHFSTDPQRLASRPAPFSRILPQEPL